jgi:hypothetical protein
MTDSIEIDFPAADIAQNAQTDEQLASQVSGNPAGSAEFTAALTELASRIWPHPQKPSEPHLWTLAYRKPRANRFQRVTNWCGTWAQSLTMSMVFGAAHPDLEVFYTVTRAAEEAGYSNDEDKGNILTGTGRRVRIVDAGTI